MVAVKRQGDLQEDEVVANGDDKKTLIVGLGTTGLAAAKYLAGREQPALVIDSRANPPGLAELQATLPEFPVVLETLDARWLDGVGRLILSPGLALETPIVQAARERGIPLVSDIELFASVATAPILAITGSNGKSTVVTLVAQILEAQGVRAPAGGNLGPSALDLLSTGDADAFVLEVSSFQMETTSSLEPLAAAVLNVSADHLDRHRSFERYAQLKEKLLASARQAIFNWDDPDVRPMGASHPAGVPFSVREPLRDGYSLVQHEGRAWLANRLEPLLPVAELALNGANREANALAALAVAASMHGELAHALEVLHNFVGLPQRCERVAVRDGIIFVNDSKGTNVAATLAALASQPTSVVLIAGGVSKGSDFGPLAGLPSGKLRAAVLLGEAAPEIHVALTGVCPIEFSSTMHDAVARALKFAQPGDTVMLSPACASQDMFRDYRERGEAFVRAVEEHGQ